jgi:hypothetical protein
MEPKDRCRVVPAKCGLVKAMRRPAAAVHYEIKSRLDNHRAAKFIALFGKPIE